MAQGPYLDPIRAWTANASRQRQPQGVWEGSTGDGDASPARLLREWLAMTEGQSRKCIELSRADSIPHG